MDKTLIAISNKKNFIKILYIEYVNDNDGKWTKIWYFKNHKNNDNIVMFVGWLSLEEIRDSLYTFLEDPIEI